MLREPSRVLLRYDPAANRWRRLPPWRSGPDFPGPARNHTTGVATGGWFYVLAGRDAANLAAAERYNPRTRRWQTLPDMRTPRHGLGGAALGNRVFAVEGGPQPGLAFSDAIEFIDVPRRR